jgi:hypothetical protein
MLKTATAPSLAAAATTPTINKNCNIINNSGVDLMVLDAFATTDDGTQVDFEQSLKPLLSNGSPIIKAGTTGVVVLDDTYLDDDNQPQPSYLYQLIIVRADNLYPVAIAPQMLSFSTKSYKDVTVTADALSSMTNSEVFQQTLQAFPDSDLITRFQQACSNAMDDSNSDTDIDSSTDAFFAGTQQFQNVHLYTLTAIQSYWEMFPYIWAGYQASKSYYLYTSDGSTVTYVGSVGITAPSVVPAGTDSAALKGFVFTFTDASNKTSQLSYVKGQFVDDPKSDVPAIALKGLFQLKSQYTNVSTDNQVMAFLSGKVNGQQIIGYNEKLSQDSNGNWSGLYTLLHPKNAQDWLNLILQIGAVAMTLELFSKPLKALRDKFMDSRSKNNGADPSKADADTMRADAKNRQANDVKTEQKIMDHMNPTIKIEININGSVSQLKIDRANQLNEDSRSNLLDSANAQADSLDTLAKYGNDKSMVDMSNKVMDTMTKLDPGTTPTASLPDVLPSAKANVASVNQSMPTETQKLASKISTVEKNTLAEAQKANEDRDELQNEIDKKKQQEDDGDTDGDATFPDTGGGE